MDFTVCSQNTHTTERERERERESYCALSGATLYLLHTMHSINPCIHAHTHIDAYAVLLI